MENLRSYVDEYVSRLSGSHDDAWHSLVEAGPAALPLLIESFQRATALEVRVALIEVISESRSAQAVSFFASLLRDPDQNVWKTALDGLVAAGSAPAIEALHVAKGQATSERVEWFNEAIDQIPDSGLLKTD